MIFKTIYEKKWMRCIVLLLPLVFFVLNSTIISADMGKQELNFMASHSKYFEQNNILSYCLRQLGQMLLKGLMWLEEIASGLLNAAYKLLGFNTYGKVTSFIESVQPVLTAVLALALLFLGYQKIINPDFGGKVFTNAVIAMLAIAGTATLMGYGNRLVKDGRKFINSIDNEDDATLGQQIVARSIDDLYVVDAYYGQCSKNSMFNDKYKKDVNKWKPIYYSKSIKHFDFAERIEDDAENPFSGEDVNEDLFGYRLLWNGEKATEADEVYTNSFVGLLDETYYRYTVDWLACYISLIAVILVYILSSYKVVRICYELAIQKIITPFFAVGDITNGKKVRQVLNGIFNAYMVLIFVALTQKMFSVAVGFIQSKDFNVVIEALFIIFIAIAVIDGPNFIEQIFGIDAGLKSGLSMFAIARTTSSLVRGGGRMIQKTAGVAGSAARGAASVAGVASGFGLNSSSGNSDSFPGSGTGGEDGGGNINNSFSNSSQNVQGGDSHNSEHNENNMQNENESSQTQTAAANENVSAQNQTQNVAANAQGQNKPFSQEGKNGSVMGENGKVYDDMYHQGAKNLTGQRYQGSIGGFLKQHTKIGMAFSKGQDLGNSVHNSFHQNKNNPSLPNTGSPNMESRNTVENMESPMNLQDPQILKGKDGRDGRDGARGEKGQTGDRGLQATLHDNDNTKLQ